VTFFDLYARKARAQGLIVAGLWLSVLPVAAQVKFVAADTTYTATTMNTMSSHYTITPMAGIPTNWKSPVDYTTGTVSVRMEVLEKPSAAKTLVNICFEGNVETCMNYPPAYTATGVINFSQSLSTFWQAAMFDYTKGIQTVAVSLKDEAETLAQDKPDFYPTKVKLTVTVTAAAGATGTSTNDDDAGPPRDAGTKPRMDAGMIPTGPGTPVDAGVSPTAPANPVGAAAGTGVGVMTPAAAGTTAATAGTTAAGTSAVATGGTTAGDAGPGIRRVSDYLESDTGCSTTRGGNAGSLWLFAGLACWLGLRGRSRRRR
jgi:hypothetical protein